MTHQDISSMVLPKGMNREGFNAAIVDSLKNDSRFNKSEIFIKMRMKIIKKLIPNRADFIAAYHANDRPSKAGSTRVSMIAQRLANAHYSPTNYGTI